MSWGNIVAQTNMEITIAQMFVALAKILHQTTNAKSTATVEPAGIVVQAPTETSAGIVRATRTPATTMEEEGPAGVLAEGARAMSPRPAGFRLALPTTFLPSLGPMATTTTRSFMLTQTGPGCLPTAPMGAF